MINNRNDILSLKTAQSGLKSTETEMSFIKTRIILFTENLEAKNITLVKNKTF
jgi:hypothetical protein